MAFFGGRDTLQRVQDPIRAGGSRVRVTSLVDLAGMKNSPHLCCKMPLSVERYRPMEFMFEVARAAGPSIFLTRPVSERNGSADRRQPLAMSGAAFMSSVGPGVTSDRLRVSAAVVVAGAGAFFAADFCCGVLPLREGRVCVSRPCGGAVNPAVSRDLYAYSCSTPKRPIE